MMIRRTALAAMAAATLTGCPGPKGAPSSPSPSPTPSPSPSVTPSPTPAPTAPPAPQLPRKPADMAKLFNGFTVRSNFETPRSDALASVTRNADESFQVQVNVTATLPRASQSLEDFAANDPKLPHVLNQMSKLIETSRISPLYDKLYQIKVDTVRSQLYQLDQVLSRHNFYDCETILELEAPTTQRKALLLIGDMDINVDGSDGDRNVTVDDSGRFFQPQTSYRWPRQTERENPFLPKWEARLAELKKEYAVPGLSAARNRELKSSIDHATRTIGDLQRFSFLISSTDPSIVLPGFMLNDSSYPFSPRIGDYAAVIYDGVIYPTIVGDAGPSAKIGEASLRLGKQINPRSSSLSRAASNIKVAYLVFPGTAEPAGPPDLEKWRSMVLKYIDEIGGSAPELFTWENTVPPWPTPTPTPTPEPSPSATPTAVVSPTGEVSPAPEATPSASPSPTFDPNSMIDTGSPTPADEPSLPQVETNNGTPTPSPTAVPTP